MNPKPGWIFALLPRFDKTAWRRGRRFGVVHVLITSQAAEHDCRNNPANACRPFLPVRALASVSLAIAVSPSASSSSRYANNPASDVTTDPRNCTIRPSPCALLLIDGEAVVCDGDGLAMLSRLRTRRDEANVFLFAFDLSGRRLQLLGCTLCAASTISRPSS